MSDFDYKEAIYIRGAAQSAFQGRVLPYTLHANLRVIVDVLFSFGYRNYVVYMNSGIGVDVYGRMLYRVHKHANTFRCQFYAPDTDSFNNAKTACSYPGRENDCICTLDEQGILRRVGYALYIGDMPPPKAPDSCHVMHLSVGDINASSESLCGKVFCLLLEQRIKMQSP